MSVVKILVYRDCICKQAGEVLLTAKRVFIIIGQISNKLFCCLEIKMTTAYVLKNMFETLKIMVS